MTAPNHTANNVALTIKKVSVYPISDRVSLRSSDSIKPHIIY
jgi:hypothetical protein